MQVSLKIRAIDVWVAKFKQADYEFIYQDDKTGKIHEKQKQALYILTDNETKEFGFGGAAGGAKSWGGCAWELMMCMAYPGTRYFIGRQELKRLRESTLQTFFKVAKAYGAKKDIDWKYNGQDHYIQFTNGSRIDLLDLKYLPSDPLYERYGSVEYTAGWIEEAGEVHFGAYDTLKSRVGRQLNDKFGILGKIFVTLNPKKNWVHSEFWKPFKEGRLPAHRKFLQSFVQDNPFIDTQYIDNLKNITDKVKKQRLLYGNFDYDDDDNALMDYDSITDIFTNLTVPAGDKFITADIARFGADKTRIFVWSGWRVIEIHTLFKKKTTEVAAFIKKLAEKHKVPYSRIVVDDDGVGGGVVDQIGCKGFVNGSSPLPEPDTTKANKGHKEKPNYLNLRSQCYFRLAARVNEKGVYVECESYDDKEEIIGELEQIKKKEVDNDKKLQVVPKAEIKELLGRSPDWADTLMMREFFELKPPAKPKNLNKFF